VCVLRSQLAGRKLERRVGTIGFGRSGLEVSVRAEREDRVLPQHVRGRKGRISQPHFQRQIRHPGE